MVGCDRMTRLGAHLRRQWAGVLALALVVAGGSAHAAGVIGANDVRSKHIAKRQVKRVDIAPRAIDSVRVRDGSLTRADFRPGEIPDALAPGPQGEAGAQGAQGPQGLPGEPGPSGATNLTVRHSDVGISSCPQGSVATGGGASAKGDDFLRRISFSANASGVPTTVEASAGETPGTGGDGVLSGASSYAVCASP